MLNSVSFALSQLIFQTWHPFLLPFIHVTPLMGKNGRKVPTQGSLLGTSCVKPLTMRKSSLSTSLVNPCCKETQGNTARPRVAGPSHSAGRWLGRYVETLGLVFVWRAAPPPTVVCQKSAHRAANLDDGGATLHRKPLRGKTDMMGSCFVGSLNSETKEQERRGHTLLSFFLLFGCPCTERL